MGGIGSGVRGTHWWRRLAKSTAEECWQISSSAWQRAGCFKTGDGKAPAIAPGGLVGQMQFCLREGGVQMLHGPQSGYIVTTDAVPAYLGGEVIYFRCPLAGCGRRCRKLYLPPGYALFGCCTCHNLTWQSHRDSGKNRAGLQYLARLMPDDKDLVEMVREWSH